MKNQLTKAGLLMTIAIALFIFLNPLVMQAQELTKDQIQKALDEAYAKFKDVK